MNKGEAAGAATAEPEAPPARDRAAPLVLYSTNTYLKYRIQEQFIGHHHAWCSPVFEGSKLGRYAIGAGQPPSSDPASIYMALMRAVKTADEHDLKIQSQKKILSAMAVKWHAQGTIREDQRDEIATIVSRAPITDWKPIIFVIPYGPVATRVRSVERARRSSMEPEFIIHPLSRAEFDIIEPAIL